MSHTENGETKQSPLFVLSFRLMAPRKLLEAQLFNKQYHSYEDIDNIPDRLRFCRHISLKSWEKYFKDRITV